MAWYTHLTIGRTKSDGTIHGIYGTIHDSFRISDCVYQGKWNPGAKNHYYHGQFEKNIPITIYNGPYEIDEILVEGNWKT